MKKLDYELLPWYDPEERRLLEMYDAQDSESDRNDWEEENGLELVKELVNVPNDDVWTYSSFENLFKWDRSENSNRRIIKK